ncbi:MAG TPA: MDR family MFS transporter [Acidimicrobiales bacterium]|jgi:EmrB/QacA subfamily drug resistance transporter|nr:MDR family MFS transporter [Acidimicrobiales bacterium]
MPRIHINPKVSVSVVFVAAMFMNIMDITIVNVALPSIGRQFHETTASLDSIAVGYLVSLAVFIPAAGWLGDRFGSKRMLLFAIAVFTGASVLCGLAQSLPELVAFRVIQGVGGGMLTPVGMAMLFRTFPPEERVRASSILTVPTAMAPAIGPVLGGLLVTALSWRWVFFVNLPIGILSFLFGLIFLDEHRQPHPGRFDVPGFLLSGVGFALLMFGVSDGPSRGWGSPLILGSIAVGLVLIAWMVRVELRTRQPLLQLRLFGNRLFRSCSLVLFFAMAAFLGVLFVVPLFFQIALGLSALASGLNTFPEAIGVMVGAQLSSRIFYPRFGPRRLTAVGLVALALAMALATQVGFDTNLWWMRIIMFAMGLSMGPVIISSQAASFATVSSADTGYASSLFNSQRQLGSAVGVALLATVLSLVGTTHVVAGHEAANLTAYHAAFLVAAGVALVGAAVALTIKDVDAAATMVRRTKSKSKPEASPVTLEPAS